MEGLPLSCAILRLSDMQQLPATTSFIGETGVCTSGTPLHEFCTTVASKSSHKSEGVRPKLLVSFTNYGYFDMAHNFIEALNRLGIYNVVMFALDVPSYERFNLLNIPTWLLASKESTVYTESSSSFGSPEFNSICNVKPWIVVECLRGGFDVVWTDTDVIWLRVRLGPFYSSMPSFCPLTRFFLTILSLFTGLSTLLRSQPHCRPTTSR